jgi:hypothetical protein
MIYLRVALFTHNSPTYSALKERLFVFSALIYCSALTKCNIIKNGSVIHTLITTSGTTLAHVCSQDNFKTLISHSKQLFVNFCIKQILQTTLSIRSGTKVFLPVFSFVSHCFLVLTKCKVYLTPPSPHSSSRWLFNWCIKSRAFKQCEEV